MEAIEIDSPDGPQSDSDVGGLYRRSLSILAGYLVRFKSVTESVTDRYKKPLSLAFVLLGLGLQAFILISLYPFLGNENAYLYISGELVGVNEFFVIFLGAAVFFWFGVVGKVKIDRAGQRQAEWEALTQEERDEIVWQLQAEESDRELFKYIHKEAIRIGKLIPQHMAVQNRIEHTYRPDGQVRHRPKTVRIRFRAILCTRTIIYYVIDARPGKLPRGSQLYKDILNEKAFVAENLKRGIHKHCDIWEDKDWNVYIRVFLENSSYGIPKTVKWADCYHQLPKTNKLSVAVGVNENNRLIYQDLTKWPHGIVAGSTYQGKSVQLTQWIITLLKRNTANQINFVFVDFKEGVEFSKFADLPHTRAFVREPEDLQEQLVSLLALYKDRMAKYDGKCVNIQEWNRRNRDKMAYIFLIVDELADIMDDRKLKKAALPVIRQLARKGRAAGIHMIFATQIVEARVLEMQIRGNFPGRICFAVPSHTESMLVVRNGMAAGLAPQGRCIYLQGAKHLILQAPMASNDDIEQVIKEAKGEVEEKRESFDRIDLFRLLIKHGNRASQKDIRGLDIPIGKQKAEKLVANNEFNYTEDSIQEIDGQRYIITPSLRGNPHLPRMVIPINGHIPNADDMRQFVIDFMSKKDVTHNTQHNNQSNYPLLPAFNPRHYNHPVCLPDRLNSESPHEKKKAQT